MDSLLALEMQELLGDEQSPMRGVGQAVSWQLRLCGVPSSCSLPEPPLKAWLLLPHGSSVYLDTGRLFLDPCNPHHYTTHLALAHAALYR